MKKFGVGSSQFWLKLHYFSLRLSSSATSLRSIGFDWIRCEKIGFDVKETKKPSTLA